LASILGAGFAGFLWLGQASRHAPARRADQAIAAAPARPAAVAVAAVDRSHLLAGGWLTEHPATGAPVVSARSAVVAQLEGRRLLYAKDAGQRLPVASLAKIVTGMVALDAARPDQVLEAPAAATQVEPNHMGLSAGERLPLRELLYGLLLDSGNDAAETIAAGTLGRAAFIDAMNAKVRSLGLSDTHFDNPSGFDGPGQYSTAVDIAVLAGTLLESYAELRTIVGTKQHSIPSAPGHKWFGPYNLNRLVWTYPGAVGVKPGYTDGAQYTLAAAATRNGQTIVAVALGSQRHFSDGQALLDYGFARAALP
jgi:D-alanyl-D-alanine carboxypeptidase